MLQLALENAIKVLVNEFLQEPYRFFTEADAVARFHQILDKNAIFNRKVPTKDGYPVNLVHREYPTFFRFEDKNPVARLDADSKASRGHYDTVILNPDFVQTHSVTTVVNRSIKTENERHKHILPFEAVVEFKLHDNSVSKGRASSVVRELGKLVLSFEEAPLRYLIVLQRYRRRNLTAWERHWPQISEAAMMQAEINSIFAIKWLTIKERQEIYHFGRWLEEWPSA